MAGRIVKTPVFEESQPSPVPFADSSMVDWSLFTAMTVSIVCMVLLIAMFAYATFSSPSKPKPKIIKKET